MMSNFQQLPEEMQFEVARYHPESYLQSISPQIQRLILQVYYPVVHYLLDQVLEQNNHDLGTSYNVASLIGELEYMIEQAKIAHAYKSAMDSIVESTLTLPLDVGILNRLQSFSSSTNSVEMTRLLLKDGRANPLSYDNLALRAAANWGDVQIVKLLLQDGRVLVPKELDTALFLAAMTNGEGQIEVMQLLLDSGANPQRDEENSAIRFVASAGAARLLLQDGRVDPTVNNNYALKHAARTGKTDVLLVLLQDPRVRSESNYFLALKIALQEGESETVRSLTESYQDFLRESSQ